VQAADLLKQKSRLGGATHRELGISRQAFAKRMSKILKAVLTKTKKMKKVAAPR
jgi:hypothetical protein